MTEQFGSADRAALERAAAALREASLSRVPCRPVRDLVGTSSDIDVGYAIQEMNIAESIRFGRRVCGRKIGITSQAVMEQVGVDRPDFGTLFVDVEFADGSEIPADRLIQPRAEAEVALVLRDDLDHGTHSVADILRATDFALPAIEIVDSRIVDWDITIVDTVADNASCGVYVIGTGPVCLGTIDLRTLPMKMEINGAEVSSGSGAACLGNPLNAARWLADTMCDRGTPLRRGDVVLTGALGPMHPIRAGDEVVISTSGSNT